MLRSIDIERNSINGGDDGMRQSILSAVEQVKSNPDKEDEAWAWFCIGAELQRLGRKIKSSKLLGQEVKKSKLADLPSSDRSDARWMFQNWKVVLEWLEEKTGCDADDPFRMLADLNHSHPSAIRRQIRAWLQERVVPVSIDDGVILAIRAAFEVAWKRSTSSIELANPSLSGEAGIEYLAELYDPFLGTTRARYLFSWSEIADVIRDPSDTHSLHETVSEWICEDGELEGEGELVLDADSRVHFRRDVET